jgi:hypothetical protein
LPKKIGCAKFAWPKLFTAPKIQAPEIFPEPDFIL